MKITDKNRKSIVVDYCHELLDGMDFRTLYTFAFDMLMDRKGELTNEQLENQIRGYYPDLLENV